MIDKSKHDDVINWKHFPRYWPSVRGIHRSPVNSPLKGQWRGALMFSVICAWINVWVNIGEAGDLSRHRAHYDVIVMNILQDKHDNGKKNGGARTSCYGIQQLNDLVFVFSVNSMYDAPQGMSTTANTQLALRLAIKYNYFHIYKVNLRIISAFDSQWSWANSLDLANVLQATFSNMTP